MHLATRLILGAAAWLAAGAAFGADLVPPAAKKLDTYFDSLAAHELANGSIAVSENGILKYHRSIGLASGWDGNPQVADVATRYRIGAVTELFTATMIMQLVEGASITLDSRLAEFYPDLPNALDITYRDLLRHRSGLPNYLDPPKSEDWRIAQQTHADLLRLIGAGDAGFSPGDRVERSSSNYLLLGYVLEKIYEREFGDILQKQITGKLGLARTNLAGQGVASLESTSYLRSPRGWVAQLETNRTVLDGAAGLVSTPTDLVTFIDALFTGKLLTAHSLESMRNQDGGSGIGLWPYQAAGQAGYGHSGDLDGFQACVYYFPEKKIAISYASNAATLPLDDIVRESLSLIFERGRKPPKFDAARPPGSGRPSSN
jgi:CubicO group peptidase (beta-lactamase class C family)